ncbi:DUF1211 domain-containing protein [Micromonospora musae]|uniref:DUF1211 domain-containing protein n=1 Tax=Micromonospora musae TaxID=1894970 RepID=A0A3A9Y557_9ACTN|nr:DUF1211 domain-containing protein [Micromonospora musae]RKN32478.1 DUF1211 domain-containing protein [Micromonospora musae]
MDRDTRRLTGFSDAVFAISSTLLVLDIRLPAGTEHLGRDLLTLWPSYLAYAITFLLIGQTWVNHHLMFDHIRSIDRTILLLNTLLLLTAAFVPFTAETLARAFSSGQGERAATVFYGATFMVGAIFFNLIWHYARRGHRLLGDTITPEGASVVARRYLPAPFLTALGTGVGFILPELGVTMIALLIPLYWLSIPGEMPKASRNRGNAAKDHGQVEGQ